MSTKSNDGMLGTKAAYAKLDRRNYTYEETKEITEDMTANNIAVVLSTVDHYYDAAKSILEKNGLDSTPNDVWESYQRASHDDPENYSSMEDYADHLRETGYLTEAKAMMALAHGVYATMQPFVTSVASAMYGDARDTGFSELHLHTVYTYVFRHVNSKRLFVVDEAFGRAMNTIVNEQKIHTNALMSLLMAIEIQERAKSAADGDVDVNEMVEQFKKDFSESPQAALKTMLDKRSLKSGVLLDMEANSDSDERIKKFDNLEKMQDNLKGE